MIRSRGSAAILFLIATACRDGSGAMAPVAGVRSPGGMRMFVDEQNTQPALRIVLPGRDSADRSIWVLFPEHVTAVTQGGSAGAQIYLFRPGAQGDRPAWRRAGDALEYERDLPGGVHLLARASLNDDGVRFHYEFTGDSGAAYSMIYAVTDPRLTGPFHDERLERTWVHDTTGLQLLASETPARLTLPLDQWLPARYLASYSWPIPAEHVQHRADGVTYYYRSRGVDVPFIATESADHAWVVASIARESGNVWSNPELTCQHVDPQTSLAPGGRAVEEMEMIVFHGKLAFAFAHAIAIRPSLQ